MRLVRFEEKGRVGYGSLKGDVVFDLEGSIFEQPRETGPGRPLTQVSLLHPVQPSKVVCVGQNYLGHIKELGVKVPQEPVIFLKPPSCLIGPGQEIAYPPRATRVDYEGELAVVVKAEIKELPPGEVLGRILGCSCFNDVTERDLAARDPFFLTLAKAFDTFGCFGPWIETGLDPNRLHLTTRLNGRTVQEDNTQSCVFKVEEVVSYVSRFMTLLPGDVVITGTPKGIGPMKPGDQVEVEIEGIGSLKNTVIGG